jgi:ankyrin repeat protein
LLLDQGVEVDVQDKYRFTPLHEAARCWNPEAIQLLLERGANVHARSVFGTTPLWHATEQPVKCLLSDHVLSNEQLNTYSSFLGLLKCPSVFLCNLNT